MKSNFSFKPLDSMPEAFKKLKKTPKNIYYTGNIKLLDAALKIAIVGTRRPSTYTKNFTLTIAKKISQNKAVVVSGGALGVDIVSQNAALPNTIMISPSSIDIIYPSANAAIINKIAEQGLILSEYEKEYMPRDYSFIERNRLVIALSDFVIIPEASMASGSMQSAKIAKDLNKPIFVFPQRLDESSGTNYLLQNSLAQVIYDIDGFIKMIFGDNVNNTQNDEILLFCKNMPTFEEAYLQYGERVLEYELEGKLIRENGLLRVNI
ncbi:DNA-processing protein DprA [Helicobacter cappadocius]|uniref:DNA-processing protein DprA n=1 Tax=Helicobacter cappadocius TaxID=3063998 RepID=A0AA90PQF9_9HELI|nr:MULTISPECIES: DNA-processing protein DprA [unclassified Helicobacter]MDO7252390.1 DNA-processing protein DprA [Helicobacter sp. faydin-H75]MDP2538257.1 DNA-processing protein DprA [Helicobacter sp. faydin-H76]